MDWPPCNPDISVNDQDTGLKSSICGEIFLECVCAEMSLNGYLLSMRCPTRQITLYESHRNTTVKATSGRVRQSTSLAPSGKLEAETAF